MDDFVKFAQKNPNVLVVGLILVVVLAVVGGYLGSYVREVHLDISGKPTSITTQENTGYIFSVASSTGEGYFVVANNGNVGVNVVDPKVNFEVNGLIRAWWAFPPQCTKNIEGAFTYDRTTHHFVGCDGLVWRILDN
jgi:hypothetical protein